MNKSAIGWVHNRLLTNHGKTCQCCGKVIETPKYREVTIEYKAFGRGDDIVYVLHPKHLAPLDGELMKDYAVRIDEILTSRRLD